MGSFEIVKEIYLRTPLGFFKMGAQLLAEDSAGENRELLGRMEGAVDLMAHLIEDLLEVAKIEAVGVTIHARPIPAETLLDDALSMLKPLAERHSIMLVTSAEPALPEVLVDYDRVLRVFSNLIVNAVKFSSPQSEVRVTAMRHGSFVRFSVIDAGQGIETGDQERLFERFWQADRADRRGAGLGLSIAKAIVAAHGGTIGVTSKVGKGSSFYFDLPAA